MLYLGIEIGGTKLQVGLGDGLGQVAHHHRVAAEPKTGAGGIRSQIVTACRQLFQQAGISASSIKGCGLGFGGPVDDRTQQTITSHQVSGWEQFPLSKWANEALGIPSVIGNDADVAGLAEATCGAGQGCNPVFYMNIGSGIGGALILDCKIHRGTGLGAGEIGHLWINYDVDTWQPGSDRWSILEHRASGWALQKASGLPDVMALLKAVQAGDAAAMQVWIQARRRLAVALSHVIALICPERIVLGGGVSLAPPELFLDPLRQEVAQIVFKPFANCYDIHVAALGEMVVVQGALALARQRFE
jgi:glucokinase